MLPSRSPPLDPGELWRWSETEMNDPPAKHRETSLEVPLRNTVVFSSEVAKSVAL